MNTIVYAARIKDIEQLKLSSSGGAFTAITDYFIKHDSAIICASYNYSTSQSEYVLITDKKERDQARGSKYMQSKTGNIYLDAYKWVIENPTKLLLFVGMGCQADGFRKFAELKGIEKQVFTVDIICHGSPSPKIWKEYAEALGKIEYLNFKDKRNGWNHPTAIAVVNGKEYSLAEYVKIYYNQCALRPSCYECHYTKTKRETDITIGDFWHIEETIPDFYDSLGTSVFLLHTDKGVQLWNNIKCDLVYCDSNISQCWQENLEHPTRKSEVRNQFWDDYRKNGIRGIVKKYGQESLSIRVKTRIKNILGRK